VCVCVCVWGGRAVPDTHPCLVVVWCRDLASRNCWVVRTQALSVCVRVCLMNVCAAVQVFPAAQRLGPPPLLPPRRPWRQRPRLPWRQPALASPPPPPTPVPGAGGGLGVFLLGGFFWGGGGGGLCGGGGGGALGVRTVCALHCVVYWAVHRRRYRVGLGEHLRSCTRIRCVEAGLESPCHAWCAM
jgi:hypothetical protein